MAECKYILSGNCQNKSSPSYRGMGMCTGSGSCVLFESQEETEMNDGASADYYKLPEGATDLQDLIEAKGMKYSVGNIFKAAYRLNDNTHSNAIRDLRKIIWFAERELKRQEEKQ